jgi:spermidine/putrescine transport system substrate-binding protein
MGKVLLARLALASMLVVTACGTGAAPSAPDSSSAPTASSAPAATSPAATAVADACKELHILTWEGFTLDKWKVPFETRTGAKVTATFLTSGDEEIAKLLAGGDLYDVATASTDSYGAVVKAGALRPLDRSRLQNVNDIPEFLLSLGTTDDQLYNMPWNWDANPFLYDPKVFPTAPTSWDILWDPSMKGKVAVWDDSSLIYIAATVLGFDQADPKAVFSLSDEQLDQVLAKLIELKPNIRKIWASGGELQSLWTNGEVAAGLGWTYIYNQLSAAGVSVKATHFPRHGAHAWMDGWAIPKDASPACENLAYDWINTTTSPEVMAQEGEFVGYSPANPKAKDSLTPELVTKLHLDDMEAFGREITFKTSPDRPEKYLEILNEFKAASGG